jgi:LCP family protein required for cell wall assembly
VLGIDEREQEEGPWRTDTMMLLTLDPVTMQAGVLSIPRDLWVSILGYSEERINAAHFLGDAYDHPGGGPALAMETVEYNLGVHIDYYARVNFNGFVKLVDLIGGVDIDVPTTLDDPEYPDSGYGYSPLHIEAGQQHFDGEMALKYARTRHSGLGDFDRARRQQQVMLAILDRIARLDMLPQLAGRAPEIFNTLEGSVKTDMALDQIIALAALAQKVDRNTIRFVVIDQYCTMARTTPEQWQILVPLRDEIRKKRDYFMGLGLAPGEQQTLEQEAATISVLNGTSMEGLAGSTSDFLQARGITVTTYSNADRQDYSSSMVILNRSKTATADQILKALDLPKTALVQGSNPTAEYDIVVILGADYRGATPAPTPTP